MSSFDKDYAEAYALWGTVNLRVQRAFVGNVSVALSSDEARLLGLKLIKSADEAEGYEG